MLTGGVDPGKACGLALLSGRRLALARSLRGDDLKTIIAFAQRLKRLGDENGGIRMAIELQHGGRGPKINFKSLATLYKRRHMWEFAFELVGVEYETVWPSTWQSQLKATARLTPRGAKRSTKDRSIELARFYFGDSIIDDAQADAALIARWLLDRTPH